ncbi:hypothetical protein [Prevotella micans]|nr:hypothetical protein [Prevotella micans]
MGRLIPGSANSEVLAHPTSSEAPETQRAKKQVNNSKTERKDETETYL